jgi:hypothetical protein
MAANGISTLSTKQSRQVAKLNIAKAKRQGKTVAVDGTVTGSVDTTKPYYRARNNYDITELPTQYSGNAVSDNPNATGLVAARPWISISYSISPNASAVNEGDTITYTITTIGVADGTTLYWTNSGTTAGVDFTGDTNSGSFAISSGSGTFTRTLKNDNLLEGTETVVVDIRTGSTSGSIVATSGAVSVADTSIPVVDQYGFFEQQLNGGTYLSFDQTIAGQGVKFICTNFNGNPTYGSYIKINGVLVAGDQRGLAPDGTDTTAAPFQMTRGHTIIVLNPLDGSMRSGYPKVYDTYGNPGLCTTMKNDLQAVAQNDIVAIGTYDATSCTADLRYALTTYFGDNTYSNTWSSSRISQMFLGKRNATP